MDEVKQKVTERAYELYLSYLNEDMSKGEYPPYKASGMAYIRFAKEQKELFKLLYMRDRVGERYPKEMVINNGMETIIHNTTQLDGAELRMFHLEMWVFVHGIATMLATNFVNLVRHSNFESLNFLLYKMGILI